jgi:hypothetical protein
LLFKGFQARLSVVNYDPLTATFGSLGMNEIVYVQTTLSLRDKETNPAAEWDLAAW